MPRSTRINSPDAVYHVTSRRCLSLHVSLQITLLLCVGLLAVATVPGCSGCRKDPQTKKKEAEKKKKKKKKPKPNFEAGQLRIEPFDDVSGGYGGKRGHWMTTLQQMRANNFDFRGELHSAALNSKGNVPLDLEDTPFRMKMSRPVSLPKGQAKFFETAYFVPRLPKRGDQPVGFQATLRSRGGGREVLRRNMLTKMMPAHQHYLVVLARKADSYAYLKTLDSVKAPWEEDFTASSPHYRVVLPKITANVPVPLPSQPLHWTTIAYVLWDDVDPTVLNLNQQAAMVDWLHWGGQVIISGPASLDSLRGSFLGDYLPAQPGKSVKLDQDAFDPLNQRFSITERIGNRRFRRTLDVVPDRPVDGVQLKRHPEARFVPHTGELLVERRVGRGRIVATAFSTTDRRIINWSHYDGFFNACLLRRPPREFRSWEHDMGFGVTWADPKYRNLRLDARLVSNLRYFSRDMGGLIRRRAAERSIEIETPRFDPTDPFSGAAEQDLHGSDFSEPPSADDRVVAWHFDDPPPFDNGYRASPQSGVAGWNDFSGTPTAVRRSLREAAGITVPNASFVVQVLGVYLLVLVPLNWSFFRIIGRVEWAWVAAPVIAIVGAVAVVRLAQLDIGFLRSRTEISVLELQGGHHRGHLTRYTALYTSLSTEYDMHFQDESSLAQPFVTDPGFQRLVGQTPTTVTFRRDNEVSLRGFPVASNSTGMVHSEQMYDTGGGIRLSGTGNGESQIVNDSDLAINGVGVLRRVPAGSTSRIEVAWIGALDSKTSVPVTFVPADGSRTLVRQWDDSPETAYRLPEKQVSLRRLLDLAQDPQRLGVGDVCLIGWTDRELEGVTVRPKAAQAVFRTLVIAHLRYGSLPDPKPDKNTRREVDTSG